MVHREEVSDMTQRPLRVAAIHDLSGFGRCSLSVILPVLSLMGVQACPIPTAILSTHTGGFGEVVMRDLTDALTPTLQHYKSLGIDFECVYTGYLGSVEQANICGAYFDAWPQALKVVDPVMGDRGKLYRAFNDEMVRAVCALVTRAQVITPNLTEAFLLLGEQPDLSPLSTARARSLLARLAAMGPQQVVVTGVTLATGEYANICLDNKHFSYWKSVSDHLPVHYPGTGDLFAAVLTGSLLEGDSLPMAMDRATRYVELTIKTTYSYSTDPREGVMLERTLEWLTRREASKAFLSL